MLTIKKSESGLSQSAALERLKIDGPNRIKLESTRSLILIFFGQFKSPLVIILIFASLIAFGLGEMKEALVIGAILFINAMVGFFQEYRAETSIAALKSLTSPRATVIRDGKKIIIAADRIVIGDLLFLEAGDIVGADARIVTCSHFQVNEAILTGESVPVFKSNLNDDNSSMVFMGTSVASGTAEALIVATGMSTELGKIAHLISSTKVELTPLQLQLEQLGKTLLIICIVIVIIVAGIGSLRGFSGIDLLIFSISLAVAAVPEGLPAIVTVALALGIERLAKKKALVRKLSSVETLGSVSIICTDKTGTLTTGQMRVRDFWSRGDISETLFAAAACCEAELKDRSDEGTGDPTEIAILLAAREIGILKKQIELDIPRISTQPFDSEKKRMAVFRNNKINYVKGAVESLLFHSNSTPDEKKEILSRTEQMSNKGLRVLGVATGGAELIENLQLIGLLGIADPPRKEAVEAIKVARRAGIIPIMITGDHPHTAEAIARELGLVLDHEPIAERVHGRATPLDKVMLVRYWKERGHIVAMTGDGVNDAPALREAHIGIAMGRTGTEVTKQAADIILTDDNFSTILQAVNEGRGIYQNIRKAIVYLLTGNFAEILVVLGAVVLGLPLPLLASHLLWINLVTDAFPALTLIADPPTPQLMREKPRFILDKIIGKREWKVILLTGFLEAAVVLCVFKYVLLSHNEIHARSIAFTTMVFSQVLRIFGARSFTQIFWRVGAFSNLWLISVIVLTLSVQLSLHYITYTQKIFEVSALHLRDFTLIIIAAFISISVIEIVKLFRLIYTKKKISCS